MNLTLMKRELRANYKLLLIFLAVLSLYSAMIVTMFDPAFSETMNAMAQSMPDIFAAFGMLNPAATLIEFVANYLYGFLLIAFPLVFLVLLANRLVARYVDRGSMAYLLATPNRRTRIILTQAAVLLLCTLVLVIYVTGLCCAVGQALFPGGLDVGKFLLLNAGWLGLLIFLGGLCFCASCLFDDTKLSYGVGAGLCIAFLLIQMLSQAGEKFEALRYATPLTLFDPSRIIAGEEQAVWMFLILYAAGILFYVAGLLIFRRRDLPL